MKIRKILSVGTLLLILCGLISFKTVSAEEIDMSRLTVIRATEDDSVEPIVNLACGSYATHRMISKGTGYVAGKTNYLIKSGACFQCSRCNVVLICEGDPLNVNGYDNTIGHYITQTASYQISNYGGIIETNYTSISQLAYCGSNKLSGYTFVGQ